MKMHTQRIHTRIKATLEVSAGLFFIFGYIWFIHPRYRSWLHGVSFLIILGLFLYSKNVHRENWREIGFRWDNWFPSGKLLITMMLISMIPLIIVWSLIYPVDLYFYREGIFWSKLVTYPLWALLQQYIAQAFFFRRLREVFFPYHYLAILFSGVIFSAAHIPNPPLMIFCLLAGIFWSWTYHKYPNLLTIALSHVVLGVICSNLLLMYNIVGPGADVLRWTQKSPVHYSLDTIQDTIPDKKKPFIIARKFNHAITVQGWAMGINGEIQEVLVRVGGKDYRASYGTERKDVALYYKNPDYLYSGFHVNIPISNMEPGFYAVSLKILLKNRFYYHYPSKRIWVDIQ